MTSGGNSFNDFLKIVPAGEITTKIEKTSFSRPWPWAYALNGPKTSIAPTLIRHWLRIKSIRASSSSNSLG